MLKAYYVTVSEINDASSCEVTHVVAAKNEMAVIALVPDAPGIKKMKIEEIPGYKWNDTRFDNAGGGSFTLQEWIESLDGVESALPTDEYE